MTETGATDGETARPGAGRRMLGIGGLIGLAIVYLVILQGGGLLLSALRDADVEYGEFPDRASLVSALVAPVAASVVLLVVVVSVLRWWPEMWREKRRVARWVWAVPISMVALALVMTDYGNLADIGLSFVAMLALGSLLVGIGEELMFRGISLQVFRDAGFTEARVALWSSLLFGGVHLTNIVVEGPGAFLQVVVVSVTGFFLYLVRRVSGTLVVPMAVHALWDFSLFSSNAGPDGELNPLGGLALLLSIVLAIVLWVRRDRIGIDDGDPLATASPAPA